MPLPSNRMTSYPAEPGRDGVLASAFLVHGLRVDRALRVKKPVGWFCQETQCWHEDDRIPTRGEHLVRYPAPSSTGPHISVVLTLAEPFVVWLA
jgi:hypothetical protein